jgi:hypothetical protein
LLFTFDGGVARIGKIVERSAAIGQIGRDSHLLARSVFEARRRGPFVSCGSGFVTYTTLDWRDPLPWRSRWWGARQGLSLTALGIQSLWL